MDFLYILHEWKKYTGELSVAITFQIFLSNNIPFEVLGLHDRQGQQCGSGKGGTPSRLERGAILWHHAACVEAEWMAWIHKQELSMFTACPSWPPGQKTELVLLGWKQDRRYSSLWNMWLSNTETKVWEAQKYQMKLKELKAPWSPGKQCLQSRSVGSVTSIMVILLCQR